MSVDALPNFLPPLDSATEAALRESIKRFGVIVPVVVDQNGNVLDGHHRSRIANELGVQVFRRSVTVRDEQEARELVADVNDHRRPRMSPEHRREVVGALREQGHSERAIARAVGVSKTQVRNDLQVVTSDHLGAGADMSAPAEVLGEDGKRYPSSRPAPTKIVQPSAPEDEQIPGQTTVDDHIDEPVGPSNETYLEAAAAAGSEDAAAALVRLTDARVLLRFSRALTEVTSTVMARDSTLAAVSRLDRREAEDLADRCERMAEHILTIGRAATGQAAPALRRVK